MKKNVKKTENRLAYFSAGLRHVCPRCFYISCSILLILFVNVCVCVCVCVVLVPAFALVFEASFGASCSRNQTRDTWTFPLSLSLSGNIQWQRRLWNACKLQANIYLIFIQIPNPTKQTKNTSVCVCATVCLPNAIFNKLHFSTFPPKTAELFVQLNVSVKFCFLHT